MLAARTLGLSTRHRSGQAVEPPSVSFPTGGPQQQRRRRRCCANTVRTWRLRTKTRPVRTSSRSAQRCVGCADRQLSQAELSSAVAISSSFLSLLEQGLNDIAIGRLLHLAGLYDVELTDLLGDQPKHEATPVPVLRADSRLHDPLGPTPRPTGASRCFPRCEVEFADHQAMRARRGDDVIYRDSGPHRITNVSKRIGRALGRRAVRRARTTRSLRIPKQA